MWGLILQILTAIAVLKGELIAQWLSAIALPITQNIVAIIFIALTIVLYQIAKDLPPETRRVIWYSCGVVTLYFFLTYNLLAFLFHTVLEWSDAKYACFARCLRGARRFSRISRP